MQKPNDDEPRSQGLTERDYTESTNLVFEARDADGDLDRLSHEASPCPEWLAPRRLCVPRFSLH